MNVLGYTMSKLKKFNVLFILITLLNTGCAVPQVPLASPELDLQAKRIAPPPDKCLIYIYYSKSRWSDILKNIFLDNNYIGALELGTYFLIETFPGAHSILKPLDTSYIDVGILTRRFEEFKDPPIQINILCKARQIYFIRLEATSQIGRWSFIQVDESLGRKELESCKLVRIVLPESKTEAQDASLSERVTIAIANLTASDFTQDEITPITANLRDALVKTGYFRIVSEEYMKATFSKQNFKKSEQCEKPGCLIEMGKLLGVEKVVGGTISKSGNMVNISLRLVNVETDELEWEFQEKIKGKLNDLFPILNSFAKNLAARQVKD